MQRIIKSVYIIALILSIFLLNGCQNRPISKSTFLLGTIIDITIYDKSDPKIIDEAFNRISEIEKEMTINNTDNSEIMSLNASSGTKSVKLSPDTFYVLEKGKYYSELSNGEFDITIGPVVKLWNIGTEYAAVPDNDVLQQKLKLVNYKKLHLNKSTLTASLEDKGMMVDLGAIAKGYAGDEVAAIMKKNGVKHALISLGGNMVVIGNNPDGNPWKIGIQDPYNPRGDYIAIVPAADDTVVTSGTYERYFVENGKTYHHILDPATGYPADNSLVSVSIIANSSIDADGLSTTCFLLGIDKGIKVIEGLKDTEAIFVTKDKKIYMTSGVKKDFVLTNGEYTIEGK